MDFLGQAWFWILLTAASELIALNPKLKSNSVIQLLQAALDDIKKKKGQWPDTKPNGLKKTDKES